MSLLFFRVGTRQQGTRLAEAEIQLSKQSLALTNTQMQIVGLLNPSRQSLAVPQIDLHPCVSGFVAQNAIDLFELLFVKTTWPARAFALG